MRLSTLLSDCLPWIDSSFQETDIEGLCVDSRIAKANDLFLAYSKSPENHIQQAIEKGASAILVRHNAFLGSDIQSKASIVRANDQVLSFEEIAWRVSHRIFDFPSRKLKVVGVTGTNGKTTTAWFAYQLLKMLGEDSRYLGTIGYFDGNNWIDSANTTPMAPEIALNMDKAIQEGATSFAMEVSSHALAERRIDGVEFDAIAFTNLTQDHLDFHQTIEEYEKAKFRLFSEVNSKSQKKCVSVINIDDKLGQNWLQVLPSPIIKFSSINSNEADLRCNLLGVGISSMVIDMSYHEHMVKNIEVPLSGLFNLENLLAAIGLCLGIGYDCDEIITHISKLRSAPGRFQSIPNDLSIHVIVDYAHTPDALVKLLDSVKQLNPKRVITVFGCGGDRDPTKRIPMARAVSERSDISIITSDNPRTESPQAILDQVEMGIVDGSEYYVEVDRKVAIERAISLARERDVVVLAGKGHEKYQIIGHEKLPFDDCEVASQLLIHSRLGQSS